MEFNEHDHPRDKDGKFTNKGAGEAGGASESKQVKLSIEEERDTYDYIMGDTYGNITAEEIAALPLWDKARKKYNDVLGDFAAKTGLLNTSKINTPERDEIRKNAAKEILSRGSIDSNKEYKGAVKKEFKAEIVIGVPAGGKSSVIVDKVSRETNSLVIDSDEVKMLLPEFDGGNGAGLVHEESSDIILDGMILPEFFQGGGMVGTNIVIPIVGKSEGKVIRYAKELQKAGYDVTLSLNEVSTQNSMKRATTRYIKTGRYLAPEYLLSVGDLPSRVYESIKAQKIFNSYAKYRNDNGQEKIERLDADLNKIDWEDWR